MVYKRFKIVCITRVILLVGSMYLFLHLLLRTQLYATLLIVAILAIYQIYALIAYVDKTNRDLSRFLHAIKHTDFSQSFTGTGLGSSFRELNAAFSDVIEQFRKARSEKEVHYRYLQTVVQHVGIGLISFKPDGEVGLINTAAKRLLRVTHLKNIASLQSSYPRLVETLPRMKSGERALIKTEDKNEPQQLAIFATELKLREQRFTLVSLQNIQSELEEKEMEAWQNLIRVLTHEIMNSVTPIASLASTVNKLLVDAHGGPKIGEQIGPEIVSDIREASDTIQKRSDGLLHFVEAYRRLTKIPKPEFGIVPVAQLFNQVQQLMRSQISENAVSFRARVEPESLELTADPRLIEQVLINLLLNALQAVHQRPDAAIELAARLDERSRVLIQVIDNGPGIIPEVLDKIFIPFFTTKQDGSGIGLSLSRQIMRLHRGAIHASSVPGVRTEMTLRF